MNNNDLGLKFIQKPFKIIHVDMDYFYAQVEVRDNPSLKDKPLAIGGPSKTKGVLCTSNYIARQYGVRSAMPTFQAFKKCPDLVLIKPNFSKYKEASKVIHQVFHEYSDKVQALSLDEAFIDVSDCKQLEGSATLIAKEIKDKIYKETHLTASAGVSFNKLLAKIASDYQKPNGLTVITPENRLKFMEQLDLRKIPGIGQTSMQRFERLGIKKCSDITNLKISKVIELFGKKNGIDLYERCLGISNSIVKPMIQRKAMSVENTYNDFLENEEQIKTETIHILDELRRRITNANQYHFINRRITHIKIKLRNANFETYTKEIQVTHSISDDIILNRFINEECSILIKKSVLNFYKGIYHPSIRLLGVGFKFDDYFERQMELII